MFFFYRLRGAFRVRVVCFGAPFGLSFFVNESFLLFTYKNKNNNNNNLLIAPTGSFIFILLWMMPFGTLLLASYIHGLNSFSIRLTISMSEEKKNHMITFVFLFFFLNFLLHLLFWRNHLQKAIDWL